MLTMAASTDDRAHWSEPCIRLLALRRPITDIMWIASNFMQIYIMILLDHHLNPLIVKIRARLDDNVLYR